MSNYQYGVICPDHGEQELSEQEYIAQMMNPNALWKCPLCRQASYWDDDCWETSPPGDEE